MPCFCFCWCALAGGWKGYQKKLRLADITEANNLQHVHGRALTRSGRSISLQLQACIHSLSRQHRSNNCQRGSAADSLQQTNCFTTHMQCDPDARVLHDNMPPTVE